MVDPGRVIATLDSLNQMSKDVDFGTFANLALYALIVLALHLETLPPMAREALRAEILAIIDDATRSVSPADNRHAWDMLERLGLTVGPSQQDTLFHIAFCRN